MQAAIEAPERATVQIPEAPERTIPGEVLARCRAMGDRVYTRHWDGTEWVDTTWREFAEQALAISGALVAEGVRPGDRVLLMSENRLEWLLCDLGIQSAGAVTVPVYPSSTVASVKAIVKATEPVLAIASTGERADKITTAGLEKVYLVQPDVDRWRQRPLEPAESDEIAARLAALSPEALATVIPTSGTTGEPKGVMLLHRSFADMARSGLQVFDIGETDVVLSFLPYAHVMERMDGIFLPTVAGATIVLGRGMDHLVEDIAEVRPTIMLGVPRVFEKVFEAVHDAASRESEIKRRLFEWALAVGAGRAARDDVRPSGPVEGLAERLVLKTLRARLTGGRLRFFISGGAPLNEKVEEFFWALGVKILQGWGLTEGTSGLTSNTERDHRYRTVGKALPGIELTIADDGEILVAGPAVMTGYMNRPRESEETLAGGLLHTGDIGFLDADGFLTITDRKKDLIKTSGGKYIAPQPIEAALMANRYVGSAMVVGDERPYAIALIVPDWDALVRDRGLTASRVQLCTDPAVVAYFESVVNEVNHSLAGFETVKRFALLPADFSEEAGELTPTLKPRRRVILEHNAAVVDELYAQPRDSVPVPV
jgi:long-chain acyl-CoA synthetase